MESHLVQEALSSPMAVVAGIYFTFIAVDKIGFWLLKVWSALKPNKDQDKLVDAVQKLVETTIELKVVVQHLSGRQDAHERRLERLEDP